MVERTTPTRTSRFTPEAGTATPCGVVWKRKSNRSVYTSQCGHMTGSSAVEAREKKRKVAKRFLPFSQSDDRET